MKHHVELPATSRVEPNLRLDCRDYRGDRPCAAGKQGVCASDCDAYRPMYHRILIIKLGALGDVIRTTALLPGLKEAWPSSHITWVTRPAGVRMLANNPLIDRLLPFDAESVVHLEVEHFDLCLSLDKEPAPAALAMRVSATQRRGIGLSRFGTLLPLNAECRGYFQLGLDDGLKFRENTKSYPELIYEVVRKRYAEQRGRLHPSAGNRARAEEAWRRAGVADDEIVIGLNTGAGEAIANKTWPEERFARLAEALVDLYGWRVALLGGPLEVDRNRRIAEVCGALKTTIAGREVRAVVNVCDGGWPADRSLDELDFAALLTRCRVVVTGDTMALHAASALEVPCVALFGPTCAQEIDLHERGTKLRASLPCAPCYRHTCDRSSHCMDDISLPSVLEAIEQWVGAAKPIETPEVAIEVAVERRRVTRGRTLPIIPPISGLDGTRRECGQTVIITIDGPAGSGKSTAARKLAARLGIPYLDTGAMYRVITLAALEEGIDLNDDARLSRLAEGDEYQLDLGPTHIRVTLRGRDVTEEIRTMRVNDHTRFIAALPGVRRALVEKQQAIGRQLGALVTEGRDQGSVAFPQADMKFFLDASLEARAERRLHDLRADGEDVTMDQVLVNLRTRDHTDESRAVGPLTVPEGAIQIDTTPLSIAQVLDLMEEHLRRAGLVVRPAVGAAVAPRAMP